jgi:hypothetical protein
LESPLARYSSNANNNAAPNEWSARLATSLA